ncbi:DUF898 family protein [Palleronia sp. KMU-117]|uniref:DUF898 family protein n=1 Tax=Palleronia sp. KMU-117 TaxID=3434108 RepID=UPI003D717B1E
MLDPLVTTFAGQRGALFWLGLRTGVLTMLTLGLYRFWMKTRLRRYFWSSVRPGGLPLEYVGQGGEKLLGFLIAVVILAFYVGIVNLFLVFASLSLFEGGGAGYLLSFLGVIPLWFYAQYRARRYVLARTRWRGIRFGLEPGAWGYAWRAMGHWLITVLSLGLLWPRMTFWLEKYRTDRTWYGDLRFEQGGHWTMLFPAARPLLFSVIASLLAVAAAWLGSPGWLFLLIATVPLFLYGLLHYRVRSLEILTNLKRAGGVTLTARPRVGQVLGIHVAGNLIIGVLLGGALGLFAAAGTAIVAAVAGPATFDPGVDDLDIPIALGIGLLFGAYLGLFLLWQVFRQVFITLPLWAHYAQTLTIQGAHALAAVKQRGRDDHVEAEGFAEALDLGAAI